MASRFSIGVDPGVNGAIAVYDSLSDKIVSVMRFKGNRNKLTVRDIVDKLVACGKFTSDNTEAYLEKPIIKPHLIRKQCAACKRPYLTAVMQHGVMQSLIGYGRLYELVSSYGFIVNEIDSKTWKSYYKLGSDKLKSFALARKFFPDVILTKKAEDGAAEAMLIARYGVERYDEIHNKAKAK